MHTISTPVPPQPRPLECILDTQAVLDWLYFSDPSTAAWADHHAAGRWRWFATRAMRDELAHVLGRGHLPPACGLTGEALLAFFDAHVVEVTAALVASPPALRCTDRDDQKFIDLAQQIHAAWLVSRDRAVLKLGRRLLARCGTRVVRPVDWHPEDNLT